MRNRFAGKCENCGVYVGVKEGRWRLIPKQVQNYTGLRCQKCSTTTKKNIKQIETCKNQQQKTNK